MTICRSGSTTTTGIRRRPALFAAVRRSMSGPKGVVVRHRGKRIGLFLFLSGAAAGRYSSDALRRHRRTHRRMPEIRRKAGGRQAARRAGNRKPPCFLCVRTICRIDGGLLSGFDPSPCGSLRRAMQAAGRQSPDGDKELLFFSWLTCRFVACRRDHPAQSDRMKKSSRAGRRIAGNAARYADAGRTLKTTREWSR